jgi:DNA-binding winged helix-turn-helix (wHTH) protein/Tfp pilus assembly protein PilF
MRFEFDGYQVDAARRLLFGADGKPIALTPKAVDTLLYLIEHRGSVVSKEDLLQSVWPDTVVEENNLNQNISALRKALGGNRKENRFIVTVQTRGYSFVSPVNVIGSEGSVPSAAKSKVLAVLPFKPLVDGTGDASLELGMADTLIARLSTIGELVVRPMSSVRIFSRADQDPLAAGHQLGADSVLEGTLQKYESKVRVTARLLNISDGKALWAGTFDEQFTDIFALQDVIAEKVVAALKLHLSPADMKRLTKRETASTEAYRLYLKGRFYWWNTDPVEFRKSREYFHRAVEVDPDYALGYCGLNSFYGFSAAWGLAPPEEAWPKAEWSIKRALEIDDSLAEAHLGCAAFKMVHRDFAGAEAEAKRAIELSPGFDEIHYFYSFLLLVMDRFDEALVVAHRALDCNPFSVRINLHVGDVHYYSGRFQDAADQYRQAIELNPKDAPTHEALGNALELLQDRAGALMAWNRASVLSNDLESAVILQRGMAEGFEKTVSELSQLKLKRLQTAIETGRYVPSVHFVLPNLRIGEFEIAREFMSKAVTERNAFALLLPLNPQFAPLRDLRVRASKR